MYLELYMNNKHNVATIVMISVNRTTFLMHSSDEGFSLIDAEKKKVKPL